MPLITHARFPATRGAVRARSWWGRAWVRAVEESAYGEGDLKKARALARSGKIGSLATDRGAFSASVFVSDVLATGGELTRLDAEGERAVVAACAAISGRVAGLLAGDLPMDLVEDLDAAGVELVPYGGELGWRCSCEPWTDPCVHALAVGYQLGWLLDRDPWVLLQLRGLDRDTLLARVHAATSNQSASGPGTASEVTDEDLAVDAAHRAGRILEAIESGDVDAVEHLL